MQVTVEMVNVLYELGQQHFSCGNYVEASELLYRFRILVGLSFGSAAESRANNQPDVVRQRVDHTSYVGEARLRYHGDELGGRQG